MAITAGVDDTVRIPLLVLDVDGTTPLTGLVNGDFTKTLVRENAIEAIAVTVTEIGSGHYYAQFVPDEEGLWVLSIVVTPTEDILGSTIQVGEYAPVAATAAIRKAAVNRLEVDFSTQELILYDDDGTTVKQRWDLETDNGNPVTTSAGVQTKRKIPRLPV